MAKYKEQFFAYCKEAQLTNTESGKALQQLLQELLQGVSVEEAYTCAWEILYDQNPDRVKAVLTEDNMLLFMMLEITLAEKNHLPESVYEKKNCCSLYEGSVKAFYSVEQRLRFLFRRIWFGFGQESKEAWLAFLQEVNPTLDFVAVIGKYSVRPEVLGDVFFQLESLIGKEVPELAQGLAAYGHWFKEQGIYGDETCRSNVPKKNEWPVRLLHYGDGAEEASKRQTNQKLAFLFCTNDESYTEECIFYIEHMQLPEGVQGEILPIWGAPSMAAGYNYGMMHTDAKMKIYMHHDTFLLDWELPGLVMEIFEKNPSIGMLGVFGAPKLKESGFWAEESFENSRLNLYQDGLLNILKSVQKGKGDLLTDGEALDGVFLATSVDLPWLEDVFTGWHYYDISQVIQMREAGYRTCLLSSDKISLLHENTMRNETKDSYKEWNKTFLQYFEGHKYP